MGAAAACGCGGSMEYIRSYCTCQKTNKKSDDDDLDSRMDKMEKEIDQIKKLIGHR